eukprot:2907931-Prymnesium_polylepis.1
MGHRPSCVPVVSIHFRLKKIAFLQPLGNRPRALCIVHGGAGRGGAASASASSLSAEAVQQPAATRVSSAQHAAAASASSTHHAAAQGATNRCLVPILCAQPGEHIRLLGVQLRQFVSSSAGVHLVQPGDPRWRLQRAYMDRPRAGERQWQCLPGPRPDGVR